MEFIPIKKYSKVEGQGIILQHDKKWKINIYNSFLIYLHDYQRNSLMFLVR